MTILRKGQLECVCGHIKDIEYYGSVNIFIDPQLKQKVMNREINSFKCDECGYQAELLTEFLYNDTSKRIMVYVYPKHLKNDDSIIKMHTELMKKDKMFKNMARQGFKYFIVFGYDEFFELLDRYKDK